MFRVSRLVPIVVLITTCGSALSAQAHFQVLVPSAESVYTPAESTITLRLLFTHPMAGGPVMDMGEPRQFGVAIGSRRIDLRGRLNAVSQDGRTAYTAAYRLNEPGDHVFYLEPSPYYEATEKVFIIQYTKVVVNGFAGGGGWDALVGFPVEIRPLVRPYGLWTGNLFRGVVLREGRPEPFAVVEVEFLNEGKAVTPPNDAFTTQIIKTDRAGVFSYAIPRAGWWAFAGLLEGQEAMAAPDGSEARVELGAVMWVQATDMD